MQPLNTDTPHTPSAPEETERMKKLLEDIPSTPKYKLRPRTPVLKPIIKRRKTVKKPKDIFSEGIMNVYYYKLKLKQQAEEWPEFPIRC